MTRSFSLRAFLAMLAPLLLPAALALPLSGCALFRGEETSPEGPEPLLQGPPVPYETRIVVEEGDNAVPESDLVSRMRTNSSLVQLASEPPDSLLGLERRARVDEQNAVKLLHSLGYYDGAASFILVPPEPAQENGAAEAEDARSTPAPRAAVTLFLRPGTRYTVEKARVVYDPPPVTPARFTGRTRTRGLLLWKKELPLPDPFFPRALPGIEPGSPAAADPILNAVEALPDLLQREGYPFAKVSATRYTLNREKRTLLAEITVDPGSPALMDGIRVSGANKVHPRYLERLITWKAGDPWDARLVDAYRVKLQQLGLFRSVELTPVTPTPSGPSSGVTDDAPLMTPLEVAVAETAFRTLRASARYATDNGFGVQGSWEHRNLFGNGELLRLTAPLAEDRQGLEARFEKPAFGQPNQKLLAGGFAGREKTDAYTRRGLSLFTGLERKLHDPWWIEAGLSVENGSLDEGDGPQDYRFFNFNLVLRRDTRNNPLNPDQGSRLSLTLAPYTGRYGGPFSTVAARIDASAYYRPDVFRQVVLAARLAAGGMAGSRLEAIPASLRFYAGGGGSVRGYAYQALGARDAKGDPTGGRSFQEISLEARFRVTESIGLVPFVDGGMVYDSGWPTPGDSLDWAAGIGLRYFTPIGPVRLDVAFPFTHIRQENRYQIYISIGQAF